jgi:hypothetical protein
MTSAISEDYAGGGDITPSLYAFSITRCGGGMVSVAASGAVRVRLRLNAAANPGPDIIIPGTGQVSQAATNLRCKRWPASIFVVGPSSALP